MQWNSVIDGLPDIPKDKYGISVLVVQFDPTYEELSPGNGQTVTSVIYSYLTNRKNEPINANFDAIEIGNAGFITLAHGPRGAEWFPCVDEITHWMYLPEPPERE